MKYSHKIVAGIIKIGVPFLLAFMTSMLTSAIIPNPLWLGLLVMILSAWLCDEIVKVWEGQKISWDKLNPQDKLVYVVSVIIILIIGLYPFKIKASGGIIILSAVIGYALTWPVIYKYGSEEFKERYLWPKSR